MFKPMLCQKPSKPIEYYLNSEHWAVEQKLDGERLLIAVKDNTPEGYNRNGQRVKITDSIAACFDRNGFSSEWIFDGELVGGKYVIFDCLQAGGKWRLNDPYEQRRVFLETLLPKWEPPTIHLNPKANNKHTFYETCKQHKVEGVVFKHLEGKYRAGSRSYSFVKHKFTKTADVEVMQLNRDGTKLGLTVGVYVDGKLQECGGCKLPPELVGEVDVGTVIEVNYLYATLNDHLYQPTWSRIRKDKNRSECTLDQFEYTDRSLINEKL